jgi:hypothetical protein
MLPMKICGVRSAGRPNAGVGEQIEHAVEAGVVAEAHGHGVAAFHEAVGEGGEPEKLAVEFCGLQPGSDSVDLAGLDGRVVDQGAWQEAGGDAGGIDKGLHGGADLPLALVARLYLL